MNKKTSSASFKKVILNELLKQGHQVTLVQYSKSGFIPFKKVKKNGLTILDGSSYAYIVDKLLSVVDLKYRKNLKINRKEWKKIYPEGYIKKLVNNIEGNYDLVLSVSHPVISHRIAYDLTSYGNMSYKKWNQVWFETWFDYYGTSEKSPELIRDELKIISKADAIFYSSEIILEEQSRTFPTQKRKMLPIDLPAIPRKFNREKKNEYWIGYFGSYHSNVRNIEPFYNAIKQKPGKKIILGNGDIDLEETHDITVINDRLPEELTFEYEKNSSVLVVLLNWFADIIPGKLYKYAEWDKPILIILDGSDKLKQNIIKKFSKYDKFYFAENNQEDIIEELKKINLEYKEGSYKPILEFTPKKIVDELIR